MDILSQEIRLVEQEIDAAYQANPLTNLSFAAAVWHILVTIEDHVFVKARPSDELTRFRMDSLVDHFMSIIRRPIFWLRMGCSPGGKIPRIANLNDYQSAEELLALASEYQQFVTILLMPVEG